MILLILFFLPGDLRSPNFAQREMASARLMALGPRRIPAVAPLHSHRDSEVRHRARLVIEKAAFVKLPNGAKSFPTYTACFDAMRSRFPKGRLVDWLAMKARRALVSS